MKTDMPAPTQSTERFVILDALRGFALLGIALANFPEFSLYTFMSAEDTATLPLTGADRILRYLLYFFIDGKFYTIFSLLFGIGFAIILENVTRKGGNALSVFYRRMVVLALIGFLHLMFIWSGDILLLYALLGMLLPPLRKLSDRKLLITGFILMSIPVAVDFLCETAQIRLSDPAVRMQQAYCSEFGITERNFAYWLHDANRYEEVFRFLLQGAWVRVQEFVDGNRYFKVMGLFLIGFYIGRQHLYARLQEKQPWLKRVFGFGLSVGLPVSALYAYSAMNHHPWGLTLHGILYLSGVYPLAFAYVSGICLLFIKHAGRPVFRWFAAPGRMALSNYITQSAAGMFIFYGTGLGLGTQVSLLLTELVAMTVYIVQQACSRWWLTVFRFGPLEWVWRMLTYGRWMACRKQSRP